MQGPLNSPAQLRKISISSVRRVFVVGLIFAAAWFLKNSRPEDLLSLMPLIDAVHVLSGAYVFGSIVMTVCYRTTNRMKSLGAAGSYFSDLSGFNRLIMKEFIKG